MAAALAPKSLSTCQLQLRRFAANRLSACAVGAPSVARWDCPRFNRPRPKLMICDKPVSALDASIQAQVINLLINLQDRLGLVFIAHNLGVVRYTSHQVMVMCLCHVATATSRDAFYAKPQHLISKALMIAMPEPDSVGEKGRCGTALMGELPSVLNPPKGCVFATCCPKVQVRSQVERPKLRQFGNRKAACHFVETAA